LAYTLYCPDPFSQWKA
jgi:hypothetical protein